MSIIGSGHALLLASEAAAAAEYEISRSIRLNSGDSAFLSRTPASAGNRKTWTWAGWVKRGKLGTEQAIFCGGTGTTDTTLGQIIFGSNDTIRINGYSTTWRETSQVFRDPSAWYHLVVAFDTTQSTASNRVKLYVNGTQVTQFAQSNDPSQNVDYAINQAAEHDLGKRAVVVVYSDFYLADVHFVDGQALDPTSFGEFDATTGVWNPIEYTGSYGTNGFHLTFSDNSGTSSTTLGKDAAGSNNWTPNNFSVAAGSGNDSLVDVPTASGTDTGTGGEVRGNYCTLNPLHNYNSPTLANGNLETSNTTIGHWKSVQGTIGISTGKWYWESTMSGASQYYTLGVAIASEVFNNYGGTGDAWVYDGRGFKNGPGVSSVSYGATYTSGDTIGVALDLDAGTLVFYKNGVSQGTAFNTGLTGKTLFPQFSVYYTSAVTQIVNFGQRPFAYTAPSGFKALCTTNLPTPTIADGSTAMDVKLYTGTGSNQSITGLNFSPDWIWYKRRNTTDSHILEDTVRGASLRLNSDAANAEYDMAAAGFPTTVTFDANGFTVGTNGSVNANGSTYVAWTWDAGSSTVTNTSGSISSQVRANASAGFSIVTYTGTGSNATVGHGGLANLDKGLIIVKRRNSTGNWMVGHGSLGWSAIFEGLNNTNAAYTGVSDWNSTSPTSTVFSISGSQSNLNANGGTFVAYCFAPVAGYSAIGSYTGNGNTNGDGAFVYLGFRPRWIMIRGTGTDSWIMHDTARNTYNYVGNRLWANFADQEASSTVFGIDILSNGFKTRVYNSDQGGWNASGVTYIYAAFAENPFKYARAR